MNVKKITIITRAVGVLGMFLILVMAKCNVTALAATVTVTDLHVEEEGEQLSTTMDLDSDGVINTISIEYSCENLDEYNNSYTQEVYVNVDGKPALELDVSKENGYGLEAKLLKSSKNQYALLQLWAHSDNDYIGYNYLFRYDKNTGTFLKLINFGKGIYRFGGEISNVYADGFYVECSCQPMETGWLRWEGYYEWKDEKVEKDPGKCWLSYSYKNLVVNRKLSFCKKPGSQKKAFILKDGDRVCLEAVKVTKNKLYACFRYKKKTGWLRVNNENYSVRIGKNGKVKGEWFKNVTKNLVG